MKRSCRTYCTQVLHLSEHAAYGRIEAARAARRFPLILDLLADGSMTLTGVGLLAPHLTSENHREVLEAARHRSKRETERLVARVRPQPDAVPSVRKLPTRNPDAPCARLANDLVIADDSASSAPPIPSPTPRPAVVRALAPARYKVQFTVTQETYEKLRLAQDLLRHAIPSGDPAAIFDRALTLLPEHVSRAKLATTMHPRQPRPPSAGSRHIPASVRREVWTRDRSRCAFVGTNGRCTETGLLEFHHVVPYAEGGEATVQNIELRCRAHNGYEAEQFFGPLFVRESRDVELTARSGPDRADGYVGPVTRLRLFVDPSHKRQRMLVADEMKRANREQPFIHRLPAMHVCRREHLHC